MTTLVFLEHHDGVIQKGALGVLARALALGGDVAGVLVGHGVADVAAAGLAFHLEFPQSRDLAVPELAGVGVSGWADAPKYQRFFDWRRGFYAEHAS